MGNNVLNVFDHPNELTTRMPPRIKNKMKKIQTGSTKNNRKTHAN